ncbi:MAG: type 1 glutamine amidotransferase [Atopobiaceae bacterium]|jgi:CobQ-like glutamine amidotransferase family enzyme
MSSTQTTPTSPAAPATPSGAAKKLRIIHLFPELLNLYGDSGNILCLRKRMEWRHMTCEVQEVHVGEKPSLAGADIVFIGGGSDREQKIVCESLLRERQELVAYVEDGGVLGAVCGGYQLLGSSYLMGDELVEGLSLVDFYTDRDEPRIIGNIAITSDITDVPIVGYENHGGRTHLADSVKPLGKVVFGRGNDGVSGYEGCLYKNVLGTYIHGPLLPKNPGVADWFIAQALDRRYGERELVPLDDTEELLANKVMYDRLQAGEIEEN